MNKAAIIYALASAALFGVSTPAAKALLGSIHPAVLAGLLYCGAGIGVAILRRFALPSLGLANAPQVALSRRDIRWLALAIGSGGVAGPLLMMLGLAQTEGATASLLLTFEGAATAMIVGFLGYGVSLALFVVSLRYLGAARTGAYFSTAPFLGAVTAVIALGEPITAQLLAAGALMALGIWLHVTERHEHEHIHEAMMHAHPHVHDEDHQHAHRPEDPPGEPHTHSHEHQPIEHAHPHTPDMHHLHRH